MGILFVFALAAAALSCTSTATVPAPNYPSLSTPPQLERTGQNDVAVVVGIENYMFLTDIDGVTETVNDWEIFFERGLEISQVYTIHNDRGTDDRIMEFAERAAEDVGEGGTLWFVFIGHGAPTEDGDDGVLVGVDAQASVRSLESRGVRRSELVETLEQGSQARTVVVIDACFSGQSSTGEALAEGMQVVVPDPERVNRGFDPSSSTVVMAAAQADQLAGPLPGMQRPAFSYVLLGALRGWAATDGEVTASDAIAYTRRQLRHLDHTQTPDFVGDDGAVLVRGATEEEPQLSGVIRTALGGPAPMIEEPSVMVQTTEPAEEVVVDDGEIRDGYVQIPAGTFTQGSPESEAGRTDGEGPQREVEITRSFLLKETPVTQGEWKEAMGSKNPSFFYACGDDCPVESVNWYEAVAYVNRLSQREGLEQCYEVRGCSGGFADGCDDKGVPDRVTIGYHRCIADEGSADECGRHRQCRGDFQCDFVEFKGLDCEGYRLPTEAEWEYAARAGTAQATYAGDLMILGERNAPALDDIAVYGGNSEVDYSPAINCSDWDETQYDAERCGTHEVGEKRPNGWGLYDMIGNVYEWTNDWYGDYGAGRQVDPTGPESGSRRVLRGCGWNYLSNVDRCRAANRGSDMPAFRVHLIGFRPARSL